MFDRHQWIGVFTATIASVFMIQEDEDRRGDSCSPDKGNAKTGIAERCRAKQVRNPPAKHYLACGDHSRSKTAPRISESPLPMKYWILPGVLFDLFDPVAEHRESDDLSGQSTCAAGSDAVKQQPLGDVGFLSRGCVSLRLARCAAPTLRPKRQRIGPMILTLAVGPE